MKNLLEAPQFRALAEANAKDLQEVVLYGIRNGVPMPLFTNA